jgi:hypothetical protein
VAFEKLLEAVGATPFTANGTALGRITLAKPWTFKVRQRLTILSDTQAGQEVQVKRVEATVLFVGPLDNNPLTRTNITAFTVADNAVIFASEQVRPNLKEESQAYLPDDLEHSEEPTNAKRVEVVDPDGRPIDSVFSGGVRRLAVQTQEPIPITGGSGGGGGSTLPDTVDIANLSIVGTVETSYTFPTNTRRFVIRARTHANLRIALNVGETATNYLTVRPGGFFVEGDIATASLTIYLLSDVSVTLEITSWNGGTVATGLPTTPTIANIVIAAANTEQSYVLPASSRRFLIRNRGNSTAKLAYISGDSGTTYITIRRGSVFTEGDIGSASVTLYFQSPDTGSIIEILSWV